MYTVLMVSDLSSCQSICKIGQRRVQTYRNFGLPYTLLLWGLWQCREDIQSIGHVRKNGRPENQSLTVTGEHKSAASRLHSGRCVQVEMFQCLLHEWVDVYFVC